MRENPVCKIPDQRDHYWCPRGDLNPHALKRALAPQASASAYSATRTWCRTSVSRAAKRFATDHLVCGLWAGS